MNTARAWLRVLGFAFFWFGIISPCHAQTSPKANAVISLGTQGQIRVDELASHWVEDGTTATIVDAHKHAESGGFTAAGPREPILLLRERVLWLRLDIRRSPSTPELYLITANPGLDLIELHWQNASGAWQFQRSGDYTPIASWLQHARKPLFRLPSANSDNADELQTIYVRIRHDLIPILVPLYLADEPSLRYESSLTYFILGGYFGLVALTLVFCAVRAIKRRDAVYASYFLLTLSMLLIQVCFTGIGSQWLWPNQPWWANISSYVVVSWYSAFGVLFCLKFTQFDRLAPKHHSAGMALVTAGFVLSAIHIMRPDRLMFIVSNIYMGLSILAVMLILLSAHMRGARNALWCLFGISPIIVGAIAPLARNFGLIGTNFWTQYSLVIGAAIEVTALFVILLKRDSEMREATVRVQALASVDPLSGASDARVFLSRLHDSLLRCAQFGHRCALVRAEITNHGWFKTEHGGEAADRVIVLAAAALRHVARDVDTVGRMGTDEFVLLIEGPTDAPTVIKSATRILARSLAPSDALPIGSTIQLHLGVAMLPNAKDAEPKSAQETLDWLRAQHAAAPRTGRSRVATVNI